MKVIFITGVHGVGKSFLGAQVSKSLNIDHCTASTLIREEKGHATWGTDKRVSEVEDNQLALIRAVKRRRDLGVNLLLDGHFVLRDASGELLKLSKGVFAELTLAGVVLLTENPLIIAERLIGRDGVTVGTKSIAEHAAAVYRHVEEVCGELKIPLAVLQSADAAMLTKAVQTMGGFEPTVSCAGNA
jgi:adenylate kinase